MNTGAISTSEVHRDSNGNTGEDRKMPPKPVDCSESSLSGSIDLSPVGKDKTESFVEKVQQLSGLDNLQQINDMILYSESEETGGIFVELGSENMLEEDLSSISEKGFFTKKEIDLITKDAYVDLLARFGAYVDPDRLAYLFPGLDLENVQDYNFVHSRIRMFVLPSRTHREIHSIIYDDPQFSGASYATAIRKDVQSELACSDRFVNISERTLIVMNETYVYEEIFQDKDIYLHGLTGTEKDIAEFYLYEGMIHEIVHKLGIFDDITHSISEGMVELWANIVAREKYANRPEILERACITCYIAETDALIILMSILQHEGFDLEVLEQAFIAKNNRAREMIYSHLLDIYGEEAVDKIFTIDFDSADQYWDHVASLYRRTVGPVAGTSSVDYSSRTPIVTKIADRVSNVNRKTSPRLYPGTRINRFLEKERRS